MKTKQELKVLRNRAIKSSISWIPALVGIILYYIHGRPCFLFATITFGDTAAPSDIAIYFDALFSQSLALYRKELTDNIGTSNAFFNKLIKSDMYESAPGGTDIREPLMYALSPMESYDCYDELSTATTDGFTEAIYLWRQLAVPVSYSMKELKQNKQRILDLVKTKMKQMEMGFQEGFATHFMQGSGDGALATPKVNLANGSSSIDPIAKMIEYYPTASALIGNINQSTSTWWRNRQKESAATTYDGFLKEWMNIYNSCALGTGGPPDLCICDQITYELASFALYQRYRQTSSAMDFPFTNIKIPFGANNSLLVLDEKIPDAYGNLTSTATHGTMYLINTKFFKMRYEESSDFEMLTDENGKKFAKPINQDSRVGHAAWMGNISCNNRRKLGVFGKIARTL